MVGRLGRISHQDRRRDRRAVHRGQPLDILNNGDEFFPAMLDDIRSAEMSITIEAYIYWAGEIGLEFARALAERARAGVRVKILLDAIGSSDIGDEIVRELEAAGCQIAWYNPIRWYTLGRDQSSHPPEVAHHRRARRRSPAAPALPTTGWATRRTSDHWRDIQIRLEGPAVTPLQTGFAQNWLETTRELISGPAYYPLHEPAGDLRRAHRSSARR